VKRLHKKRLSRGRASKKERALLIFRSKTGFRAALLQRRGGKKREIKNLSG
jgi:hypothetical protein